MSEQTIEIRTADGTVDGTLLRGAAAGTAPGVIFLPDVFGIRDATRALAQRVADQGYSVLLVNPFYRTGRAPLWSFKPNWAEERTAKRFGELTGPLTPEAIERDAGAYVEFLSAQPGVSAGPIGVVGYCFTGGVALRIAAAQPERIAAAASFHGGGLCTDAPTSPHTALPKVKARLYFAHAVQDRSMPQSSIDRLEAALAAWGGKYRSEVYEGAMHGWTQTDAAIYNEPQAERAFTRLTELFAQTLK